MKRFKLRSLMILVVVAALVSAFLARLKSGREPLHNYHHQFLRESCKQTGPNMLTLDATLSLGDANMENEQWFQRVIVKDEEGNVVFNRDLGHVDVPAGASGGSWQYHEEFELLRGTYCVTIVTAYPECKWKTVDHQNEPGVMGWYSAVRTVE
jgi:hypothetical protein